MLKLKPWAGTITKLTVRQDNNIPKYLHDLRAFFTAHPEYKVIHGHYSGFGMFYNAVARRCGCRCGQATATTLPMSTTWWASWTG